jgi:hypothetical protein
VRVDGCTNEKFYNAGVDEIGQNLLGHLSGGASAKFLTLPRRFS